MPIKTGINNVKGFLPAFDSLADERQKHSVFFVGRMEEGADMAVRSERCVSKMDRLFSVHRLLKAQRN
jgi:hypothetical protein